MNNKKSLLMSMGFALVIFSFSEIANAQEALNHDHSSNATPTGQSTSTPITGTGFDSGIGARRGTDFQSQTIGGGNIYIPQDIVNLINVSGTSAPANINTGNFNNSSNFGTDSTTGGNVSTGTNPGDSTTGSNVSTGTDSTAAATEAGISPDQIVICLTDSCSAGGSGSGNTISVNDLAKLMENNLNQALNDLVAAEKAESIGEVATDNSRNIVRRPTSSDVDRFTRRDSMANEDCGCVPGARKIAREPSNSDNSTISQNTKTLAEARQIVETKLEDANILIEQINQLNPDNNIW